jgi:hypothetical protein
MASRSGFNVLHGNGVARKQVVFRFLGNSTSDPATIYDAGDFVATVTRSGVGTYLVTLRDAYKRLISAQATVQCSAATALFAQFGDFSNEGTSTAFTAVLRLVNGSGTATEMAANANNSVSVTLEFEDSGAVVS